LNLDATIDNLHANKQQVLIAANKSFVNTTMEESLPEIVREALQNLFMAPPALQPPLLPCPGQILDNGYTLAINSRAPSVNSSSSPLLPDP
jgi:hypothetical protein